MDAFWQAVIWSAIPVAVLLLAAAVTIYGLRNRQPPRREDPVERAYLAARARKAGAGPEPESMASPRPATPGA